MGSHPWVITRRCADDLSCAFFFFQSASEKQNPGTSGEIEPGCPMVKPQSTSLADVLVDGIDLSQVGWHSLKMPTLCRALEIAK